MCPSTDTKTQREEGEEGAAQVLTPSPAGQHKVPDLFNLKSFSASSGGRRGDSVATVVLQLQLRDATMWLQPEPVRRSNGATLGDFLADLSPKNASTFSNAALTDSQTAEVGHFSWTCFSLAPGVSAG